MITPDVTIQCATCCQKFMVPSELLKMRKEQHEDIKCPLGHSNVWPNHEDEVRKLTKEVERLKEREKYEEDRKKESWKHADHLNRRIYSLRGHITRLQRLLAKRVGK